MNDVQDAAHGRSLLLLGGLCCLVTSRIIIRAPWCRSEVEGGGAVLPYFVG